MAQVTAVQSVTIGAPVQAVFDVVADYNRRSEILPPNYRDFTVIEGGKGAGTVAEWTLQATEKRSRNVRATIAVAGTTLTETDANSSMVTTWQVSAAGEGSTVTITTSWQGAGGIGGFFEKTFAPLGLKKIYTELLTNLKVQVESN